MIAGWSDGGAHLLALDPGGAEQWRLEVPAPGALAIDPAGRIFLGHDDGVVHAFSVLGQPLWTFAPALPGDLSESLVNLAATGDALFTASLEQNGPEGARTVVRRLALATGELAWETRTEPGTSHLVTDLVVRGELLVAVGQAHDGTASRSLLAVFDLAGDLSSLELGDKPAQTLVSAAAIGDGDLVFAGFGSAPATLERRGPDLLPLWTAPGALDGTIDGLAVGPGERIAVTGHHEDDGRDGVVRLWDGAGVLQWTSTFPAAQPSMADFAAAAAFGPDFLVVAGHLVTEQDDSTHASAWVRRIALDG